MSSKTNLSRRRFFSQLTSSALCGGYVIGSLIYHPIEEPIKRWLWKGQARAAVSLSYDDDYTSHLDIALPDLEQAGFRATFYLPVGTKNVELNLHRWKQAYDNGHEIGSHTFNHPSATDLIGFTPDDIQAEVANAANWLERYIGSDKDRTFAYPNGVKGIGPDNRDLISYERAIARCHIAARVSGGEPNIPSQMYFPNNLLMIGAKSPTLVDDQACYQELVDYYQSALVKGGWAVFYFHEIAERDSEKPLLKRDVHNKFLTFLKNSPSPIWIAPVGKIARYVLDNINAV